MTTRVGVLWPCWIERADDDLVVELPGVYDLNDLRARTAAHRAPVVEMSRAVYAEMVAAGSVPVEALDCVIITE